MQHYAVFQFTTLIKAHLVSKLFNNTVLEIIAVKSHNYPVDITNSDILGMLTYFVYYLLRCMITCILTPYFGCGIMLLEYGGVALFFKEKP